MIATSGATALESRIAVAVEGIAAGLREAAIKKAVEDFETALRKQVGVTAISLLEYYSVEHVGPELVIRVRIEKP